MGKENNNLIGDRGEELAINYLKKNKYFAIVIGDVYKKSEVVPLGFYIMNTIKQKKYTQS